MRMSPLSRCLFYLAGVMVLACLLPLDVTARAAQSKVQVAADLSDRTWADLRSSGKGLPYQRTEWVARVEGQAPSGFVVLTALVRDGRAVWTARAETRGGGSPAPLGTPPIQGATIPQPECAEFIPGDQFLPGDQFISRTATRTTARDVRDWTADSIRAATPRRLDSRRFDALLVVAVPIGLSADVAVRAMAVAIPRC